MDEFRTILFLDIETVACSQSYSSLDDRLKVQWARKAAFFRHRDNAQTDEQLFNEKAGIYAEFGKIIVIAMGKFGETEKGERTLRTKYFAGDDEKQILLDFKAALEKMDQSVLKLCAHNGKEFDFPYLCRRMLVNGITLPSVLNMSGKKNWEVPFLDTMDMWKFGDYKHYTSLDLLTTLFDIPSSKGDMDGSKVNEVYYQENNLDKIAAYCTADVVAVAQLYLRLKGAPVVIQQNILNN